MLDRSVEQRPWRGLSTSHTQWDRLPTICPPVDQGVRKPPGVNSVAPSPTMQKHPQPSKQGFELPPLPPAPSSGMNVSGPPPPTTRLAGVSSILNHVQTDSMGQDRRRKGSDLASPRMSTSTLPPIEMIKNTQSAITHVAQPPAVLGTGVGQHQLRKILIPKSPGLHHPGSSGQSGLFIGPVSVQQGPLVGSPRSRALALEAGTSGAPQLSMSLNRLPPVFTLPAPIVTTDQPRRTSSGAHINMRSSSESASPTTSYSSYSQADQTSPGTQYLSTSTTSGAYSSTRDDFHGQERQRPVGIPISSSGGQNMYQMMTLETSSGSVQLPVDVQAASRVADEKRRRNAGASARFRQRRKEKEKEASSVISTLEQKVKDLTENMDFYKRERDYMAAAMKQVPGGDRHFPRPSSPKRRRSSSNMGHSAPVSTGYGSAHEITPRSPGDRHAVRRDTSRLEISSAPPAQTITLLHGAPYHPGPGTQMFGTPIAPYPSAPLQLQAALSPSTLPRGMSMSLPRAQQTQGFGPPQLMQASPQTGPWNPYGPDRRPLGHLNVLREVR